MEWVRKDILLNERPRGFHLITDAIIKKIPEISTIEKGILHLQILHTSAALTINENADPTVREDFASFFDKLVPENLSFFKHTYEGADDMPAHIKASLLGFSIQVPVKQGKLQLGTWQGIYLCEFRNQGGARKLACNLYGIPL